MKTENFKVYSNGHCKCSKIKPDQTSIIKILECSKKKPQKNNLVIIARNKWLIRNKLSYPENLELANLCLMIKNGELIRAFYSNELSHVIKKQNYLINILN
jgi:hypothetical protein